MSIKAEWNERYRDASGERQASRVLKENLHLFSGLQVLLYREKGCVGDVQKGFRDEAMLVGMKNG